MPSLTESAYNDRLIHSRLHQVVRQELMSHRARFVLILTVAAVIYALLNWMAFHLDSSAGILNGPHRSRIHADSRYCSDLPFVPPSEKESRFARRFHLARDWRAIPWKELSHWTMP